MTSRIDKQDISRYLWIYPAGSWRPGILAEELRFTELFTNDPEGEGTAKELAHKVFVETGNFPSLQNCEIIAGEDENGRRNGSVTVQIIGHYSQQLESNVIVQYQHPHISASDAVENVIFYLKSIIPDVQKAIKDQGNDQNTEDNGEDVRVDDGQET